jgi:hypothetical protein
MDTRRKLWNQGHRELRRRLSAGDHPGAIELFLAQHAMLHAAKMTKTKHGSFEDEVLSDISEDQIRCIPPGGQHSIAWILLHLARIEDITMNLLVAGTPQVFVKDDWAKRLDVHIVHSANKMDTASLAVLSDQIDIPALRAYRLSVGRRTREIVKKLMPEQLHEKVKTSRLQKVMEQGALLPEAIEILNYWSKRTITGLLLMPPTRHNFLHLNEALRIKHRILRSTRLS